jgi:hypothetical protein
MPHQQPTFRTYNLPEIISSMLENIGNQYCVFGTMVGASSLCENATRNPFVCNAHKADCSKSEKWFSSLSG